MSICPVQDETASPAERLKIAASRRRVSLHHSLGLEVGNRVAEDLAHPSHLAHGKERVHLGQVEGCGHHGLAVARLEGRHLRADLAHDGVHVVPVGRCVHDRTCSEPSGIATTRHLLGASLVCMLPRTWRGAGAPPSVRRSVAVPATQMYRPAASGFSRAATCIAAQSLTSTKDIESLPHLPFFGPLVMLATQFIVALTEGCSIGPNTPVGQIATYRTPESASVVCTSFSCRVLVQPYQLFLASCAASSLQCSSVLTAGSGCGATADMDEVKTKSLIVPALVIAVSNSSVLFIAGS
mmetsp:Transcript_30454/g.100381  ORF Transcript_30454/g.100381 Transcript_30454/m.100381 type:complete len:296 (+) Transcript_30454:161-1048(+)